MNIICIIPARGGSKAIPYKNLIPFCGKPLLAWSIEQASMSQYIKRVYVSSDYDEIIKIAESYGAIGIKRPKELATDTSASEEALLHALDYIEKELNQRIDAIVFLQATSPLREKRDIDGAIEKFISENADSLFSGALLEDFCVWEVKKEGLESITFNYKDRKRRQDRKTYYLENGSIYLFKPHVLRTMNNRLGGRIATYDMDFWKTWEIDSLEDKALCEWYFMNRLMKRFVNLTPAAIDLIVYDFDGVMTDNRVLTLQDGTEAIFANRTDGLAINMIKEMGIPQIILSTEENAVVEARARKIGIPAIHGTGDKSKALQAYCEEKRIDLKKVLYVGNDMNDLDAMKAVGFSAAPADAHPSVKRIAKMVLKSPGGAGVVRELVDILKKEGKY